MPSRFAPVVALAALAFLACSSDDGGPPVEPPVQPPPPKVNEVRTHAGALQDTPYAAETVTQFRTTKELPELAVRSLAWSDGSVYAGAGNGLYRIAAAGSAFEKVEGGTSAVVDLAVRASGEIVVARAGEVEIVSAAGQPGDRWALTGEAALSVAVRGAAVFVGTDAGLMVIDASGPKPVAAARGFAARDLALVGDVLFIATDKGVRRYDAAADTLLAELHAPASLVDDDVRAIAASDDGTTVVAASAGGVARIRGGAATLVKPGKDALPSGDVRAIAERGGEVLSGHAIGATAMTADHKDHYHSLRWIPGEEVTAVLLAPDRTRWIGTKAGVSRVTYAQATLSAKADRADAGEAARWRHGFVSDAVLYADAYDHSSEPARADFDNDGLWTEMQIASWCFAYSVTKDERYYQRARRAMDMMFLLVDVPARTFEAAGKKRGFVARSLVADDEGALFTQKASLPNWHRQEYDGRTYYWKDDTSSDEYAGHFFGMPIFRDLCAKTDDERRAVADHMAAAMRYVIDGNYWLMDLDGEPTTHGRWRDLGAAADGLGGCVQTGNPDCLNLSFGGGWLNSIEILGHLLATWVATGDPLFYREYERLATAGRYADMIPIKPTIVTLMDPGLRNHSDHELATLAYYTLLRYEPNDARRAIWSKSLVDFWNTDKEERNPFELGVVLSALPDVGSPSALPDAVRTLREMPEDWRQWPVDNSHRLDADRDVNDRFKSPQFKTVLPYDEIRTVKWNSNLASVKSDGDGRVVQSPWPYLLPYWMLRYYGAITP